MAKPSTPTTALAARSKVGPDGPSMDISDASVATVAIRCHSTTFNGTCIAPPYSANSSMPTV
ncbi:hypothetical protein H634G_11295 [Metarhizium anisopliae BRIP 53293]|uniref:Uncharacterized protein n=1 Tax=Metarhizium anisopliae BRIP 53293 TaxID=1291518 RepID=A0A0D9NHL5_METAN|nr:hypothetical protein H634G_11293 [Metarhizium anisopliae BRIP 53293]KJK73470.1 hypothetical protein H634G_11295 [Metarhizium anisopliae BRIP 53293]